MDEEMASISRRGDPGNLESISFYFYFCLFSMISIIANAWGNYYLNEMPRYILYLGLQRIQNS